MLLCYNFLSVRSAFLLQILIDFELCYKGNARDKDRKLLCRFKLKKQNQGCHILPVTAFLQAYYSSDDEVFSSFADDCFS